MRELFNFFALRPTFTFWGLRFVWYLYLVSALVQSYVAVSGTFQVLAQRGISWEAWLPNFVPFILSALAQLAIVRLLLEVAATILFTMRPTNHPTALGPRNT